MEFMNYTKSQMLRYIKQCDESIRILPIYVVNSKCFYTDKTEQIRKIIEFAKGRKLIVRSSSVNEDGAEYSNAGEFESVLDVLPEEEKIMAAVDKVYLSYHTDREEEILIQPMLQEVEKSGVIFTSDMDTFAEYDIINYSINADTTAVTGGTAGNLRTFVHYRNSSVALPENDLEELIAVCRKIEKILNNTALDIEFGITKSHQVYIFQVRPIATGLKASGKASDIKDVLSRIYRKVDKLSRKHPFLLGKTTYFGVMPDWNPAEILGVRPRKLAISLYKELVTDSIWAHQRNNYGYRDLTMHPLMVSFCGIPYIDTRITFNSFIPKKLNEKIAEKLVNYYLDRLKMYPKYHDKIEFEIVYSCYYFGISDKLKELLHYGFNENEIKRIEYALLDLTNEIINPKMGLYKKDIEQIAVLEKNYNCILQSELSLVDKIYWLMEECKKYGTLPFAGVARAGFIAVQFLKSFIEYGIITDKEYDLYMSSLSTVNKRMAEDLRLLCQGNLSREEFLKKYGHIRPGTYDILSKRYDEDFDSYFQISKKRTENNHEQPAFEFDKSTREKIQLELEQHGLLVTADELLLFFREAIEGREYLKFIFTKSVSMILSLIEELGNRVNIRKEDMSFLDITVIKQLYTDLYCGDVKGIFMENIEANKRQHAYALQLKLPSIIVEAENVYQYYLLDEEPNYITQKKVCAEVVTVNERMENKQLSGKIVFIQSADPGYDYLFSKNIGGLITQFGGANSHMAIRCAELGIPAVIGAGEKNFSQWSKSKYLILDCMKRQVIIPNNL